MYNGIGLATVRGTATSGHVQVNRSHVRVDGRKRQQQRLDRNRGRHPNDTDHQNQTSSSIISTPARERGNAELQKHYLLRNIENKLLLLREELEEQNIDPDVIEASVQIERQSEMEKILQADQKQQASKVTMNKTKDNDDELEEGEEIDDTPPQAERSNYITGRSNDNSNSNHTRTCFNCGQPGHFARECTQPKQQQFRGSSNHNNPSFSSRSAITTNAHIEREQKIQHNEKLAQAFGMEAKPHVEGMAFDQVLQKQLRDEKKAKLLQDEQRKEEIAQREAKKEQKIVQKEQRRLDKEKRKADKQQKRENRLRKEHQNKKRRRRRSPSSSSSSSSDSDSDSSRRSYSSSSSSSGSSRSSSYTSSSSVSRSPRKGRNASRRHPHRDDDSSVDNRASRSKGIESIRHLLACTKGQRRYSPSESSSSSSSSYSRNGRNNPRRPVTTKRPQINENEENKRKRAQTESVDSEDDARYRKRPNDIVLSTSNHDDDRSLKDDISDDAHRHRRNSPKHFDDAKEQPQKEIDVVDANKNVGINRNRHNDADGPKKRKHGRRDASSSSSRSRRSLSSRGSRSYSSASASSRSSR